MKHIEDAHQEDLIVWSKTQFVSMTVGVIRLYSIIYAIPNGGKRNPKEAARLKRQGVKAGVSDLNLPLPVGEYAGLWIELKRPIVKGKPKPTVSSSQKEWGDLVEMAGHKFVVCFGKEEAKAAIKDYLGDRLVNGHFKRSVVIDE